jgi:hypothetical protein
VTAILMAASCAAELQTSPNYSAARQLQCYCHSSRRAIKGVPIRSITALATSNVFKRKEERRESKFESARVCRACGQHDLANVIAGTRELFIISPYRIIELSGTPPPTRSAC